MNNATQPEQNCSYTEECGSPRNPITTSSPVSSKTDSPHSPTSPHYPPTSSAAAQAPSSPSAHTSVHERSPLPPWAGKLDYEHRTPNRAVSAQMAAHMSSSSTRRQAGPGVRPDEAVIAACRIPAVRRGGRLGLAAVVRRSSNSVSRAKLACLGAMVGGGMVGNRGFGRVAGVGEARRLSVGGRHLEVVRRNRLGRRVVQLCMD